MFRACLIIVAVVTTGCASLVDRASSNFARQLSSAVLDHNDPETVADGLPAFLLTMDAMSAGEDASVRALCNAAELYGAYAGSFVTDAQRRKRLAERSIRYAERAACQTSADWCSLRELKYDQIDRLATPASDAPLLYCVGSAWASHIQANADDWNAIAAIPKARRLLEKVVELEPAMANGQPLVALGVMNSLLPPAYGGKPDVAKEFFDEALAVSGGQNQMARVLYAQYYARLVFDKELHDRLLDEALSAPTDAPGLTLINTLAQRQAQLLKDSAKDYFE
jgi:hypothetical protein